MKQKWKGKNAAAFFLFTAFLLPMSLIPALAAGPANVCYAYESQSSEYFWSWSVMVEDVNDEDVPWVFTASSDEYEKNDTCVLKSGATDSYYTILCGAPQYADEVGIWYAESAGNDASVLKSGTPSKNENVAVHYIVSTSEGASLQEASRTVTDIRSSENQAQMTLNEPVEATHYPGFLVNAKDECVGILVSDSVAISVWFGETSNNDGGRTSAPSGSDGGQTNPPSGSDSGRTSTPSNDGGQTTASPDIGDTFPHNPTVLDIIKENMALVIVSIIAVGAVAFAVIALKIKPKPEPPVTPTPPVGPTQVTYPPPAPNPNPYTPTQPTPNPYTPTQPVNIPQNLFLSCKGGHYDGQQIPLRGSYITMGREQDNTIKFPDDYQAVSRHHAILRFENGILTLEDTSSTGTYLKRIQGKIPPRQQIRIDVGDVFYLGERKNRFEVMRMG